MIAAAAMLAGIYSVPAEAAPPNIVFVLVDDLRHDALGVTGHPFVKTPNIDRIGREGAVFRNTFVTTPLCSPSRASFLTGQLVRTHGVRGNGNNSALSHKLVTFPKLIQQAGYETGYVGKWHMGNDDSPRPGFDRWVSFKGQGAHLNPQINVDGKPEQVAGYMTDILSDHAVEFVTKPRSKPFLLYLAHKAVHGPFVPAERHKELYADQPIKRTPNANDDNKDKPVLLRPVPNQPARPNQPRRARAQAADQLVRNQLRMLTAIDEGIGRILKSLEESKQLDNTVIVFTSDNGYFWGEHGLGDKRWAYEESIKIPLLVRYPGKIKAGTQLNHLALNIDIAPTLLEIAGAAIPKEVQGVSLMPMLQENRAVRARAFLEYFNEPRFRTPSWRAVRTERWKYVRYDGMPEMDELFDLQSDPYEMSNAISKPEAQQTLKDLRSDLETQFPVSGTP
jgi:N-acetylglucosamine-6-sulfatase